MLTDVERAWLAGFWDGEGSIGIVKSKTTCILLAQLSHTDRPTVIHLLDLLDRSGIAGRGYTYQERDPSRHRDAHYILITGMANVREFCLLLLPYVVTKREHCKIAIEFAERRIELAGGIDNSGHLKRGGMASLRRYSEEDMALVERLCLLNKRGPSGESTPFGRILGEAQ